MIYVNYNAYIVHSKPDEGSQIKILQSSDPTIVIKKMKETNEEFYNPIKYWNQPAAVMKKSSKHTCYTMSELLDWRQVSHKVGSFGLRNHEMVQRFIRSAGEKQATFRLVLFQDE